MAKIKVFNDIAKKIINSKILHRDIPLAALRFSEVAGKYWMEYEVNSGFALVRLTLDEWKTIHKNARLATI